jgi:hypothetical protein
LTPLIKIAISVFKPVDGADNVIFFEIELLIGVFLKVPP